ncbi:general secretion pathway protein GspB [Photobacterium aphoticum]|uniref:general secretion pathway protein GspB n=2 Tax=Photobacterium aphoticum TaxID=754436 RepID=UPI00069DB228|nr:general secretion pathway protein GspB [Photobacterium aphoticum]GHA66073.1 hypothetical protein GCM10007086_44530 [Photobacterium aphoticum]
MSKLLSAIAKSESQHTGGHNATSSLFSELMTDPRAAARRGAQRYRTALLFALPVVALVGYGVFTNAASDSATHVTTASAVDETPPVYKEAVSTPVVEVIQDEPYFPAGIERLSYPDLYTEPLPSHPTDPDVIAAAHTPFGTTAQGEMGESGEPLFVPPTKQTSDTWDLDKLDYSGLSPELALQLRSAIAATEEGDEPMPEMLENERAGIPVGAKADLQTIDLADLPMAVKKRIPKLDFQTHIYSSSPDSRWVKVNGEEAYEGDEIAPGVVLKQIAPRNVAFTFENFLISMPALSSW